MITILSVVVWKNGHFLLDRPLARLTTIQEAPGSIPGYTLEIFLEV